MFPMNPSPPTPFNRADLVVAVIPARLASTRFPNKVLANKTGQPMVQHVWEAARRATLVHQVVVATDDERVANAVRSFGGTAIMTRADHPNGTSRLGETAVKLALHPRAIVINVQGDEPELEPALIDALVETMQRTTAPVATLASPFQPGEDPTNPSIVKVVLRRDGSALYFSRSLVPHPRDAKSTTNTAPLKHVGMYAYRREFLDLYATLAPTPLESTEMLEQLRILEHGHTIAVAVRNATTTGIDTPEQYEAFVRRWLAR